MHSTHSHPIAINYIHRRRGVVALKVAILSVVLIGFVALGVDVGLMYNARQELQRATTAASMAAAATFAQSGSQTDATGRAEDAAIDCAARNEVVGVGLTLVRSDVIFGQADQPEGGGPFVFAPSREPFNAVRVIGRRTSDSKDGGIPLYFGAIFGKTFTEATFSATAMMMPRDIVMVADMSNSLNNDSELRHYQRTFINLHEVWANTFVRGDWPGWDDDDLQAAGWGWGFFKEKGRGFGYDSRGPGPVNEPVYSVELDPEKYLPEFDVGLVKLPFLSSPFGRAHWDPKGGTNKDYQGLEDFLKDKRKYQGDFDTEGSEIRYILGDVVNPFDPKKRFENWKNRAAVATGFADWNSGIEIADPDPGKKAWWERQGLDKKGNGDEVLDDDEIIWSYMGNKEVRARLRGTSTSEYMKSLWFGDPNQEPSSKGYADYIARSESTMVHAEEDGHPDFQWRFGVKTFMNFMLDKRPSHEETDEFKASRSQPMQAVKEAVGELVRAMSTDVHDQLSLVVFGTTARNEVPLTTIIDSVPNRLDEMQAGYYDGNTNIAAAIRVSRESLKSALARPSATKVLILLSDGVPTAYQDAAGNISTGSDKVNVEESKDAARKEAELAHEEHIVIYAIKTGVVDDGGFMEELADITGGRFFSVSGTTIEEFAAKLRATFITIAGIKPVALIE